VVQNISFGFKYSMLVVVSVTLSELQSCHTTPTSVDDVSTPSSISLPYWTTKLLQNHPINGNS